MKVIALFLIKCYKFISKFSPPRCRLLPSCSTYAYQVIEIYGFFKGSFLALKRIIRCNPFCKAGFDNIPLPKKKI
ncbi:MAG: membrane protein insertion efficiency factor YidD [Endomicrobiia bacterium]|nr:MAG: membrane protein insertion efficiency factor YidD [Endomicrobiia bacterium]